MKTLISTLILGGSLIINGCESKKLDNDGLSDLDSSIMQTNKKEKSELEKYNLENKQIYEDFKKFCNSHKNKKEFAESQYLIDLPNQQEIYFSKNFIDFKVFIRGKHFSDDYLDGLDNKSFDSQTFTDKNTGLIKNESIKSLSPEKQLSLAQEYTNVLKEILHKEKEEGY